MMVDVIAVVWTLAGLLAAAVGVLATALFAAIARIDGLRADFASRFERLETRLDRIEDRLTSLDGRVGRLEARMDRYDERPGW